MSWDYEEGICQNGLWFSSSPDEVAARSNHHQVPLKSLHLDVKVVNFASEVTVKQNFINNEKKSIECVYYFPVEEEAAVVDFEAEIEGRVIRSKIKESSEAIEEYNEAVASKQTSILLEEIKQDIFVIKFGGKSLVWG